MNAAKFETGKTYSTRSICDHNCVIIIEVISRTDKTIKAKLESGEVKTFKPFIYDDSEWIRPWGKYSMAPTIQASRDQKK